MKINYAMLGVLLSSGLFCSIEAKPAKQENKYREVSNRSVFNRDLKRKEHAVVLFYNKGEMTEEAYNDMVQLYNKVTDLEHHKDKKDQVLFLAVNTAKKGGRKIFTEYNVLDEGELVEEPAILLFRKGTQIDNQVSGNAFTEKHVEQFIERYFTELK